ncbi:helix-turn-helix domain-containing protein [uncultured Enterococcus sp.]|uniref:helix-turn-helix domain-containing protein n=1 Tax=uncultured Enterococcus sp. TaxID=167972 RepID=UPI002AA5E8D0|nr:helix-turn-helix domain-containing protein [uncultured Enterococcus sp.]
MEQLITTEMTRRILLLNLLYGADDWLTTEKLAARLHCSTKTVFADCRYIEERWPDQLTIETSKKSGIKLTISTYHSIHDIYVDIIKRSDSFTLMEAIFFHPRESSDEMANRIFLSSSSLYRLSRKLNKALKERHLSIESNPFTFSGTSERQIRYFFISYFIEVYGVHKWPFHLDKTKILNLARKINKDFQLYLSDFRIIQMAFSIAVTLTRLDQGFTAEDEMEKEGDLAENLLKCNMEDYQQDLASLVSDLNVSTQPNWKNDFCYSVFWWIFGNDSPETDEKTQILANQLILAVNNELNTSIDDLSRKKINQIIRNLYCYHRIYPYKKHIIYSRFFYSGKSIKQNFILFSTRISKVLTEVEMSDGLPWNTFYLNEVLHDFMLYWEDLPTQLFNNRGKVSIAVLSDLGKEHAEVMGTILRMTFLNNVSVTTQNASLFDSPKKQTGSKRDLYVSNHHIEHVSQEKVVVVEDILSSKNIVELRKIIEQNQLFAFTNAKKKATAAKQS